MKNNKLKSMLVIGGMIAGAVGSIGIAAFAQSNTTQPAVVPVVSQQNSDTDNIQDKGGVEVADKVGENDGEQNDAVEQANLQAKTKITAEQAKTIALSKVPGTVTDVQLGDENGTLSYEVTIGTQEVKVNAIDGSITKIEKSDKGGLFGHHDENDANEAPGTEIPDSQE